MQTLYENTMADAGWAVIPRGVFRVEGRDAIKWLHKIVTADVEGLATGEGAYSALLDAKGHFVADFVVLRDGEALGLLVEPSAREQLLNALKRYIIREKVALTDVTERWQCLTLIGNQSASVVERVLETRAPTRLFTWAWGHLTTLAARVVCVARARVPAYDIMLPDTSAALVTNLARVRALLGEIPELDAELLEVLRIEAGLPRWGIDFDETTLALEIPDVMQIRVDQGCYVGQEVVARIVHRGHVNRHLRGLRIENDFLPTRGDAIHFEGAKVGSITSSAHSPRMGSLALGYVRRNVEVGAHVQVKETNARVVELPFADS